MANLCSGALKVTGKSKKDIAKFLDALNQRGNTWIGRGLWTETTQEQEDEKIVKTENGYAFDSSFQCKWSIHSACFSTAKSMREHPEYWHFGEGKNSGKMEFLTLTEACKKFNVNFEAYSEECGCCFSEHYVISDEGVPEKEECVDYDEYCMLDYNTKEEAEIDLGFSISDEEWEEEYISRGGFPEWTFSI